MSGLFLRKTANNSATKINNNKGEQERPCQKPRLTSNLLVVPKERETELLISLYIISITLINFTPKPKYSQDFIIKKSSTELKAL